MNLPKSVVIVVVAAASLAQAERQSKVTSKLQVHVPSELHKKDGYDHREALFGIPPYGGSIQQQLYYADSTLCDSNVNTRGGFPKRNPDGSGQPAPWSSPFLLMVDRGGCTFVTKVRHAQRAGAAGVIIADNACLCKFEDKCTPEAGTQCEDQEPIMADDGSGQDISIPSFLMFKQDADPLKETLKGGAFVRMEMAWAIPSDDEVEFSLWSVPAEPNAQAFEEQFGDAAALLGKKAKFTPHFNIYSGLEAGCDKDGQNQCLNLCTNKGRYCASDPDADVTKGASGADVVTESLRRLCIWDLYGHDGFGKPWWDYVKLFVLQCAQSENEAFFSSLGCIKDAMEKAGVDYDKVEKCMNTTGLEEDVENAFLEKEVEAKTNSGVVIWPAVFVNGAPIRGALDFDVVFKAVCAGFSDTAKPAVCEQCASCRKGEYSCVKADGVCGAPTRLAAVRSSGVRLDVFVLSVMVIILIFACIAYTLHKRSQRQVRDQVRGILAEYMPLDEDKMTDTSLSNGDGEFS